MEKKIEIINNMEYAFSESNNPKVCIDILFNDNKISDLKIMFEYLFERYSKEPQLLTDFFQHKSDACHLEVCDMEKMEDEFAKFVFVNR